MDLKCRTCLELTTNRDIDLKNENELIAKIELLIGIQIAIREEYPSNICAICVEKIDDFIKFRYLVIETDSRIQQFLCNNDNFQALIEFNDYRSQNEPIQEGLIANSNLDQTSSCEEHYQDNIGNDMIESEESQNNIITQAIKIEAVALDEPEIKADHGDKTSEILCSGEFLTNKIQSCINKKQNFERTCRKYKCPDCHELFSRQRDCSNHRRKMHKKVCSVCGSALRSDGMAKHMRLHKKHTIAGKTLKKFGPQDDHQSSSKLYEVNLGNDVIKSEETHNNHTAVGGKLTDLVGLNEPTVKVANVDNMYLLCSNDILETNCHKSIDSKQNFEKTCEKNYKCKYCDLTFANRNECINHKKTVHLREICIVCGLSIRSDYMNRHMRKHQILHKKNNSHGEEQKYFSHVHEMNIVKSEGNLNNIAAQVEKKHIRVGPSEADNDEDKMEGKICTVYDNSTLDHIAQHRVRHQPDGIVGKCHNNNHLQGEEVKCCGHIQEDNIKSGMIKSEENLNNITTRDEKPPEQVESHKSECEVDDEDKMHEIMCSDDILKNKLQTDINVKHNFNETCERKYDCNYCDQVFSSLNECRNHRRRVHFQKTCSICDTSVRKDNMARHLLKHQKVRICKKTDNITAYTEKLPKQVGLEKPQFRTDDKEKMYEITCSDNILKYKIQKCINADRESDGTWERRYNCHYCDQAFDQLSECLRHRRVHFQKICNVCGTSVRSDTMAKHLLKHQKYQICKTIDRKYKCQDCDKIFSQHREYRNHRRSVHLQSICTVCGTVILSDYLRQHMMTHQNNRIACTICNKLLKNGMTLRTHMLVHKTSKYQCEICQRIYKHKKSYSRHLKIHEDPDINKSTCKICGKKVRDLKKHMMSHTGERPYPCKFCRKGFTSLYSVKVHLRQHTNERPYVCEFCTMRFAYKVSLVTHLKSKHDKKKE